MIESARRIDLKDYVRGSSQLSYSRVARALRAGVHRIDQVDRDLPKSDESVLGNMIDGALLGTETVSGSRALEKRARAAVAALEAHPSVAKLLRRATGRQVTYEFTALGLLGICVLDLEVPTSIWDLKTSIKERLTLSSIRKWSYHVQAWLYGEVARIATGKDRPFGWIYAHSEDPDVDSVELVEPSQQILDAGRRDFESTAVHIKRFIEDPSYRDPRYSAKLRTIDGFIPDPYPQVES